MGTSARLAENPVRLVRTQEKKTLKQFSEDCLVGHQTLYLTECGVHPTIIPKIFNHCIRLGYSGNQMIDEYEKFQHETRLEFKRINNINTEELPEPDLYTAPVASLWRSWGLTYMGFAKGLCVMPALLYRLERGDYQSLPGQIRSALKEIGMTDEKIEELNTRTEEYYDGKHRS